MFMNLHTKRVSIFPNDTSRLYFCCGLLCFLLFVPVYILCIQFVMIAQFFCGFILGCYGKIKEFYVHY